jgi:hypothetical protein
MKVLSNPSLSTFLLYWKCFFHSSSTSKKENLHWKDVFQCFSSSSNLEKNTTAGGYANPANRGFLVICRRRALVLCAAAK